MVAVPESMSPWRTDYCPNTDWPFLLDTFLFTEGRGGATVYTLFRTSHYLSYIFRMFRFRANPRKIFQSSVNARTFRVCETWKYFRISKGDQYFQKDLTFKKLALNAFCTSLLVNKVRWSHDLLIKCLFEREAYLSSLTDLVGQIILHYCRHYLFVLYSFLFHLLYVIFAFCPF